MNTFYPLNASALKTEAKARMQGYWSSLIIAAVVVVISSALSSITRTEYIYLNGQYIQTTTTTAFSALYALLVAPVVSVGVSKFFLNFATNREYGVDDIKYAFSNYGQVLLGMLWQRLFIFLWSLLFVIPGIIKAISYSMTKYILAENPNVGFKEAIKISMVLTDGRKSEVFGVAVSFIGWFILSAMTLGILNLYVAPFFETTMAQVYEQLKGDAIAQGRIDANIFNPYVYSVK